MGGADVGQVRACRVGAVFGPTRRIGRGRSRTIVVEVLGIWELSQGNAARRERSAAPQAGVSVAAKIGHTDIVGRYGRKRAGEVIRGVVRIDGHHIAAGPVVGGFLVLQHVGACVFRRVPGNGGIVGGNAGCTHIADMMARNRAWNNLQLDVVLHRQAGRGRVGGSDGIVVGAVAIDVHSAVGCA